MQSRDAGACRQCSNALDRGESAPSARAQAASLRVLVEILLPADPGPGGAQLVGASILAVAMLGVGASYGLSSPLDPTQESPTFLHQVLSSANLVFHEAGHWIFGLFGRFIGVLGGTLMETLVPIVCAASFLRTGNRVGAAFSTWWCGQVLTGVAAYAADARAGRLVLLGGVTGADRPGYHDWNNLLRWTGLLEADHAIGWTIHLAGVGLMLVAIAWACALAWRSLEARRRPGP